MTRLKRKKGINKNERKDTLAEVGIKVEYGEQLVESLLKGTCKTMGDKEHAEMISLYVEENMSMVQIGKKLNRSSRTPQVHIDSHNVAVKRSGFCAVCKRAEGNCTYKNVTRTQFELNIEAMRTTVHLAR